MNKLLLTKREKVLVAVIGLCLVLLVVSVINIANLKQTIADNNLVHGANLRAKSNELNEQSTYIDTICGEYRKLYGAYEDLYAKDQAINKQGYARPGAAKGQIDECYQTQ